MVILGVLTVTMPLARAQHGNWGPEPPVAPISLEPLPSERVVIPMIFPVLAKCRMVDGYGALRGDFLHSGIDIRAPKMSPIVAPFGGVLGMKDESFWIYADDGWAMLGTHLNDDDFGAHDHAGTRDIMFAQDLSPAQRVHAGQLIGYVGESGDATAPHLHFEIYAPGPLPTQPRIRDPFPSLLAAKVISTPIIDQLPDKPEPGVIRIQGCIRRIEPAQHRITVIVTAKQSSNGVTLAVTHVRYLRFTLPDPLVAEMRGWDGLGQIPKNRVIGILVPDTAHLDDATALRIITP